MRNLIPYLFLTLCLFQNPAYAGNLEAGKKKAQAVCAMCHGLDGQATTAGNSAIMPNITAQQKDYMIAKLSGYKSGKIQHPQMSIIAQMLTDEEIENVAEWYSRIKITILLPEG